MVLALATLGCGHILERGVSFQHDSDFDFRNPPSQVSPRPANTAPADAVVARYLGAGGLYVGWRDSALLIGPFFSNPRRMRIVLGHMRWDREAIRRGLEGLPLEKVGAILVGHSHYDHLGDVPVIASEMTPGARLFLNCSGFDALQPFPILQERTSLLEKVPDEGLRLTDARGKALPFRILAVPSGHAPQIGRLLLWKGSTKARDKPWTQRRHGSLRAGQPYALVIDLLGPEEAGSEVLFRLYYQDAASEDRQGLPPQPAPGDPPYDLAVLCAASSHQVAPAPAALLARTAPAHVLVTHYDNFFRPWGPGQGLAPLLTPKRLRGFLLRVESSLGAASRSLSGPQRTPLGPSNAFWTLPLVGEWLEFGLSNEDAKHGKK